MLGLSYGRGVAVAAGIAVPVVMLAALTLVPALLSYLAPRHPWTAAILAASVLIALAIPATGLRLGFPDASNDRQGTTTRAAYELVSRGFGPGANGPLLLAAELPQPTDVQAVNTG